MRNRPATIAQGKALAWLVMGGAVLAVACEGNGQDSPAETPAVVEEPSPLVEMDQQREVIGELTERFPLKEFTSFEEAEEVAGYHIPRPSAEYPIAYGLTYLRWFPERDRPFSETKYTLTSLTGIAIGVEAKPSYYYPDGDQTVMDGRRTTVAGKTGWMLREDTAWVFAFECASVDEVKVWCQVTAVREVGWEEFDHFVSTIE